MNQTVGGRAAEALCVWGSVPVLQQVEAGEERTPDDGDLLPASPLQQLWVEITRHQGVYLLDDITHLGQDLLATPSRYMLTCITDQKRNIEHVVADGREQ